MSSMIPVDSLALTILSVVLCPLTSATNAWHRVGPTHADVFWQPYGSSGRQLKEEGSATTTLRILHVTDSHVSLWDDKAPRSSRMHNAFAHTTDYETRRPSEPKEELVKLFRKAADEGVDLLALGGDIVNFPADSEVSWVLEQLRTFAPNVPFIYTAGNHDWHLEGDAAAVSRYDDGRLPYLSSTLRPLYEASAAAVTSFPKAPLRSDPGAGLIYGHTRVKGVEVFFVDNSNHQVNEEQLVFARNLLEQDHEVPAVLLLHMPLHLPGVRLDPKYLCGHPAWGADTDELWQTEGRQRWPEDGNLPSTKAFIELVRNNSAPSGRLISVLTGHVHRDFSDPLMSIDVHPANLTALACDPQEHSWRAPCSIMAFTDVTDGHIAEGSGALQYNTLDAAEGGYRMLTVHLPASAAVTV